MKYRNTRIGGYLVIQAIVFTSIAVLIMGSLISWAAVNIQASRVAEVREQAFQLAEAGIEYYRWHLAHAPTDYQDGTGEEGPYVHEVEDQDGRVLGVYSLSITPPINGSTRVRIESTGIPANSDIERTIAVEMAIPSLARYAVVANSVMRFGEGTEVFGPIHSNGGVRFDGVAHNVVTSAQESYDDPDHSGGNEFGVHTHVNAPPGLGIDNSFRALEAPPNGVPSRPDVFIAGRQFPVPATDFVGITTELAQIKSAAQSEGVYYAPSGAQGYEIVLRTNGTMDVYRVTSLRNPPSGCYNSGGQDGWGTWSINNRQFLANRAIPENGLIFIEDHLWIRGQIDGERITIASGRFPDSPSTRTNIIVTDDLRYTSYDGSDVIGLIAQDNVHVGMYSENNLRIDAALVAQNGRIGRYYYPGPSWGTNRCSPYHVRNEISLYGMIATNERYGFAYTDGNGYGIREIIYDAELLYGPPPSFPLTSDQYEILSWEEI